MEATLQKFEDRFSDYTTLYNDTINPDDCYIEICFLTAEYLYELLKETLLKKTRSIDELIPFLQERVVIYFEFLMERGESHALCFIVEGDEVIVCQSIGGTFRATHESFLKDEFVKLLEGFYVDNDPLTHAGHAPIKKLTKIKIASRKEASPELIPEITPEQEVFLRRVRTEYIKEIWPNGDQPLHRDYRTERKPDVYSLLILLQSTY